MLHVLLRLPALLVLFLLAAFMAGCSRSTEVSGEVFVVTNDGTTVPLALVEILFYDDADESFLLYVDRLTEKSRPKEEQLASDLERARTEHERALLVLEEFHDRLRRLEGMGASPSQMLEATGDASILFDAAARAEQQFKRATIDFNAFSIGDVYLSNPPAWPPAATTRTDSAGRFAVEVPHGPFGLLAKGSRRVGDRHEEYFWILRVDEAPTKQLSLSLSNHNMTSSEAPQSLVKTVR